MSEGFTIANFRTVAHGPQEGQFAVGDRKKALGLSDLDPKYRRLLDEPVTMTLGLIGPGGRVALTPIWFDYEGEKVLVNTASHRPKCESMRKSASDILLVNPKNPYHWVQIKCTVEKELRDWEPGGKYVAKQFDRIWHKYTGHSAITVCAIRKYRSACCLCAVSIGSPRSANRDRPLAP